MIDDLEVAGFKRFSSSKFQFAPLTVLSGLNGSGKTSLLQTLLLISEATSHRNTVIPLNGPFGLSLGTAVDVLNWHSTGSILFALNNRKSSWRLGAPDEDSLFLTIEEQTETELSAFSGNPRAFTYLSAERFGPRSHLATSAMPANSLEIGVHGEFSAHLLSVLGDRVLENPKRSHPLSDENTQRLLKYEVEQWLSEIVRPIELAAQVFPGSTMAELRFRTPGTQWVRATNMGFGVSYALPIVVAGLLAADGGLFIVENPEAHLHPEGQSRMGVFLAWLAGKGVQLVVETHSDHILNGMRRAIGEFHYLAPASAIAHYFGERTDSAEEYSSETIFFRNDGSPTNWPTGFFDQYQIDVSSLGRIRRKS